MTQLLQPILFPYDADQEGTWVEATPFRAHLTHLLAAGLTEPVIARMAGISSMAVVRLAHGRDGRPVRRVSRDTGRRLLRITTTEARAVRVRPVPVHPTRQRLRDLVGAGSTVEQLAADLAVSIRDLEAAVGRGSATCSQLVALKVAGAYEQWGRDAATAQLAPAA